MVEGNAVPYPASVALLGDARGARAGDHISAPGALALVMFVACGEEDSGQGEADAAHWILTQDSRACTGNFFIDDQVLAEEGVSDFDQYAVSPGAELMRDFFV